jgi:hypothetical protein
LFLSFWQKALIPQKVVYSQALLYRTPVCRIFLIFERQAYFIIGGSVLPVSNPAASIPFSPKSIDSFPLPGPNVLGNTSRPDGSRKIVHRKKRLFFVCLANLLPALNTKSKNGGKRRLGEKACQTSGFG